MWLRIGGVHDPRLVDTGPGHRLNRCGARGRALTRLWGSQSTDGVPTADDRTGRHCREHHPAGRQSPRVGHLGAPEGVGSAGRLAPALSPKPTVTQPLLARISARCSSPVSSIQRRSPAVSGAIEAAGLAGLSVGGEA